MPQAYNPRSTRHHEVATQATPLAPLGFPQRLLDAEAGDRTADHELLDLLGAFEDVVTARLPGIGCSGRETNEIGRRLAQLRVAQDQRKRAAPMSVNSSSGLVITQSLDRGSRLGEVPRLLYALAPVRAGTIRPLIIRMQPDHVET